MVYTACTVNSRHCIVGALFYRKEKMAQKNRSLMLMLLGFWGSKPMLKYSAKRLQVLLTILSVVTFVNILVIYWIPINIPLSSFSAVRTMFVAFAEKRYHLILASVLICVLLFLSTISVHRQRSLLPVLSLLYLIYDFVIVVSLLIDGIGDGCWRTYIIQTIFSITLIVLLCIYCWNCLRNNLHSRY